LEDHDIFGRAPPRRPKRALRVRRRDQRRALLGLRRAGTGADTAPGRRRRAGPSRCAQGQGRARGDRGRGRRLRYLPPYSPDLNPIEQAFAKLKALLRAAASRTVDTLWQALGHALDAFTPAECANYLAHAGYVPSNQDML
jgi:hypothetical protein